MLVEIYVNCSVLLWPPSMLIHTGGSLLRQWHFEFADYREVFCQVGFEEKEKLWDQIKEKCINEKGVLSNLLNNPWVMYVIVPARIQPADIDPDENERFLNHIIEKTKSSL
jgi:hypothetical protein